MFTMCSAHILRPHPCACRSMPNMVVLPFKLYNKVYHRCRFFYGLKILLILHTEEHLQSKFCG